MNKNFDLINIKYCQFYLAVGWVCGVNFFTRAQCQRQEKVKEGEVTLFFCNRIKNYKMGFTRNLSLLKHGYFDWLIKSRFSVIRLASFVKTSMYLFIRIFASDKSVLLRLMLSRS